MLNTLSVMKAVIIDDEPAIGNTISSILKKNFSDIIVIATAGSVAEGLTAIMLHKPEIVFLDVELPDGSGFDILKQLSSVTFRIIFITGHRDRKSVV